MMRVRFKLRRFIPSTVILVIIRQNVLHNVEKVLKGTHLRAAWDRLYVQLFCNASP